MASTHSKLSQISTDIETKASADMVRQVADVLGQVISGRIGACEVKINQNNEPEIFLKMEAVNHRISYSGKDRKDPFYWRLRNALEIYGIKISVEDLQSALTEEKVRSEDKESKRKRGNYYTVSASNITFMKQVVDVWKPILDKKEKDEQARVQEELKKLPDPEEEDRKWVAIRKGRGTGFG